MMCAVRTHELGVTAWHGEALRQWVLLSSAPRGGFAWRKTVQMRQMACMFSKDHLYRWWLFSKCRLAIRNCSLHVCVLQCFDALKSVLYCLYVGIEMSGNDSSLLYHHAVNTVSFWLLLSLFVGLGQRRKASLAEKVGYQWWQKNIALSSGPPCFEDKSSNLLLGKFFMCFSHPLKEARLKSLLCTPFAELCCHHCSFPVQLCCNSCFFLLWQVCWKVDSM